MIIHSDDARTAIPQVWTFFEYLLPMLTLLIAAIRRMKPHPTESAQGDTTQGDRDAVQDDSQSDSASKPPEPKPRPKRQPAQSPNMEQPAPSPKPTAKRRKKEAPATQ